jgi:hypothetical protein
VGHARASSNLAFGTNLYRKSARHLRAGNTKCCQGGTSILSASSLISFAKDQGCTVPHIMWEHCKMAFSPTLIVAPKMVSWQYQSGLR